MGELYQDKIDIYLFQKYREAQAVLEPAGREVCGADSALPSVDLEVVTVSEPDYPRAS